MTQTKTKDLKKAEANGSPMRTLTMTNKEFMDVFMLAFNFLANQPTNPKSGNLKYGIKRTIASIQKAGEAYTEAKRELFEEYAQKDEHGNPKFDNRDNYLFETPELRKDAFAKLKVLNEKEVEIRVYPVALKDITNTTKLSISHEIALGGFIREWTPDEEE